MLLPGIFAGCHRSPQSGDGSTSGQQQAAQKPRTDFEEKLQYVRNFQESHMYVFTRKDGGAMTKDDIDYLKANTPKATNTWVKTEDNRRIIAGTNFDFTTDNFAELAKRFNVEDYTGK
jgi:hypothetical protein